MTNKYLDKLFKKMNEYDKKATNPFLENHFDYNPFKSIYEQTYIWVDKEKEEQ